MMSARNVSLALTLAAIAVLLPVAPARSDATFKVTGAPGEYAVSSNWDAGIVPQSGTNGVIGSTTYNNTSACLTSDVSAYVPGTLIVGKSGGTGQLDLQLGAKLKVGGGDGSVGGVNGVGSGILVGCGSGGTGVLNVFGGALSTTGTVGVANGCFVVGSATVSGPAGAGTVNQSGGLVAPAVTKGSFTYIGRYGAGVYSLSGGTLAVGTFRIGSIGGNGAVVQTGGLVTVSNDSANSYGNQFAIGNAGEGSYQITGGSLMVNAANGVYVGYNSGSSGTFNIGGSASVSLDSTTSHLYVGDSGTGQLNVSGGTLNSAGGTVNVGGAFCSSAGAGTVTLSGVGVFSGANQISVGGYGPGTYNVQDAAQSRCADFIVGVGSSTGIVNQTGGVLTSTGTMTIGFSEDSTATYNLRGGTLCANILSIGAGGTLSQSGGQADLTGDAMGTGSFVLSGGTFNANGYAVVVGVFKFSGGALLNAISVTNSLNLVGGGSGATVRQDVGRNGVISGNIYGDGSLTKTGGGNLSLTGSNYYAGKTTVQAGTLRMVASAYSNVLSHTADIQGGQIVFDYLHTTTPARQIRSSLRSGAIYTSTGAAAGYVVGYNDDGVSKVTAKVALLGDTDLGGTVNNDDLARLLSALGGTDCVWQQGDLNYDAKVNNDDLAMLLSNLGKRFAGVGGAKAQAIGGAVPEPSTLVLLTAGLAGLLLSAWRRWKYG
ncbi:MAG: autotransporter-associated beta strand repeat-containing protein [Thermoguttaceae bacterium]